MPSFHLRRFTPFQAGADLGPGLPGPWPGHHCPAIIIFIVVIMISLFDNVQDLGSVSS